MEETFLFEAIFGSLFTVLLSAWNYTGLELDRIDCLVDLVTFKKSNQNFTVFIQKE